MRRRYLLREIKVVESNLKSFEFENALIEMSSHDVIARLMISEERKIQQYALSLGASSTNELNEGMFADIALGVGQVIGGLPIAAQFGVGAAVGAAGVLWYGKEMVGSSPGSFDFFMNLIFALLSAAAIDPSGVFAESGALGKLIKPFAYLGKKVRDLGGIARAMTSLGPAERTAVAAAEKVAGPLSSGLSFLEKTVLPSVSSILESVKSSVMSLPGGEAFAQVTEFITKYAGQAIQALKDALSPFIKSTQKQVLNAAVSSAELLIKKMSPEMAERIFTSLAKKPVTIAGVGTMESLIITDIKDGKIWVQFAKDVESGVVSKARNLPVSEYSLPDAVKAVASAYGKDAAAAMIVKAQASFPQTAIKSSLKAVQPFMGAAATTS